MGTTRITRAVTLVAPALDQALLLELVEVADERRRLDAHELGELALAGALVDERGSMAWRSSSHIHSDAPTSRRRASRWSAAARWARNR